MSLHNKISQSEISIIKSNTDKTARELSVMLGRHIMTIRNLVKTLGLSIAAERRTSKRINNAYFKTWTDEMAYICGFIAADGCILEQNRGGMCLEISLNEKDTSHLSKISSLMGFSGKLMKKTKYKSIRFAIGSRELCTDLIAIGITPRKSLTLRLPDIPKKFMAHFIRGYFDGDGYCRIRTAYVTVHETCKLQMEFSMLGTLDVLSGIRNYINSITGKNEGSIEFQATANIFRLTYSGTNCAKRFGDIIYENSTIHLERKKLVFDEWLRLEGHRIDIDAAKKIISNYSQKTLQLSTR